MHHRTASAVSGSAGRQVGSKRASFPPAVNGDRPGSRTGASAELAGHQHLTWAMMDQRVMEKDPIWRAQHHDQRRRQRAWRITVTPIR